MFKAFLLPCTAALAISTPALAQDASGASRQDSADTTGATVATNGQAVADPPQPAAERDVVITGRRLDEARAGIQASLGATSYTITNATIQALPGGDNQQFDQIILQLPGVVQDGFGQFHVRDDHNNLQYRINGTILPEGVAVFGQTLSPRLIEKFDLLTGALPAQYGLRTAGIIDITTKSGFSNGGSASIYGGSHEMIEPSIQYGGTTGSTSYFASGDYRHSGLGIESVDGSSLPIHDKTDQYQGFVYVDHVINDNNKVSFVGGYANQYFQIPDPAGLRPDGTYNVAGQSDYRSEDLNERQIERTGFGQLALLHDAGPLTIQFSLFGRYSELRYRPDLIGELLFNGQAQRAFKQDLTFGGQIDAAYRISDAHTLRGGVLLTRDHGTTRTTSYVFPVDDSGAQTGQPVSFGDQGGATELTESAYLQDEWKLLPHVTFNYGARFDHYDGYRAEQQLSPRANIVWQPIKGMTAHIGYARYFSPPPFENVATTSIATFAGTSAAAPSLVNTTPFAERQNYYDVGVQQVIGHLTFGVDGYYRQSRNLVDEGQFGAPIILTPFNYRDGRIKGAEFNASYAAGPWLTYANFAYAKAQGRDIVSSQFSFTPTDLAYISNHYIYLDHDQTYTASAGFSYSVRGGALRGLKFGADGLYGSGLRTDGDVPNGGQLPGYVQVNLSSSYRLEGPGLEVRFDVINVGDRVYEIRDGSGVGVGAPQYGARRGFFVGLTKSL